MLGSVAVVLAAAAIPHLPTASELAKPGMQAIAPDVWVAPLAERSWVISFTHLLDDKTVYPANAMALDTPDGAVLIDPGWEPAQSEAILNWARATLAHPVKEAIVTHSHADRSAGIGVLQKAGIPALGLARTTQILEAQHQPGPAPLPHLEDRPWTGPGGIEVRYPGPGHAPDNLVVWIPWARVLYGGCFVKSVTAKTLGNLEDADVKSWPGALERVRAAYPEARTVVPGHGTVDGNPLQHTLDLLSQPRP